MRGTGIERTVVLFHVVIRHGYYENERCTDLALTPTADSTALLARYQMDARMIAGDLVVTIPSTRLAALRDRVVRDEGRTRLTFTATPASTDFLGLTALPIDTDPRLAKLHLDNRATAMPGIGPALLGGADGVTAAMLRPVVGSTLRVPALSDAALIDVAGTVVATGRDAGDETVFDLGPLPAGLYRAGAADYLHVPSAPRAIALIDLFLKQPAAGKGDLLAFPLKSDGGVATVELALRFAARATYWHYYIVDPHGTLDDDLAIAGTGAAFARSDETLPNGHRAAVFASDTAVPLAHRSRQRFSLTGQSHGADGTRRRIGIARLPTAPASPVWPRAPDDPVAARSDIYVYV